MRIALPRLPSLLLACLLPACGTDPDTTAGDSSTTAATTGTLTTGQNADPTTGATSDATTSGTTSGATTDPTTGATTDSTGAPDPGTTGPTSTGEDTGSTGAVSASDTSTSETSTSETSTSDSSTGDPGGLGQAAQDAAAALELAVDGVLYLSESEDEWTVFAIADVAPVTGANVKDVIADIYVVHDDLALADRAVELRTLAQLMDPLTVMQDWWGDYEMMQAEDYKAIRAIFEQQLTNAQVFRLGEQSGNILVGQIDVFVIGETVDGDIVGMFAVAVET